MTPTWQMRRSKFNHDWLKNRYLPAFAKWMNILHGLVEDAEFESVFLSTILPQWETESMKAMALVDSFRYEMSPQRLLEQPMFQSLAANERWWLGPLVDDLWAERARVAELQNSARDALVCAGESYQVLRVTIGAGDGSRAHPNSELLLERSAKFREACQQVARRMEALPVEILVV